MIELKQNTSVRVPVRLLTSSGVPVTGVVVASVTATIEKSDGTVVALTLTGPDWTELTTGAFAGAGKYTLVLPTSTTSLAGPLTYAVAVGGADIYVGLVKVVASESVDLRRLMEGRWKIYDTGPDINRLVLYSSDGSTVLQKWDLKNASGGATTGPDIFERVPTVTIP